MRLAVSLLGAVLLLRAAAVFAPTPWLWGLDSLADRPVLLRIAGIAAFSAALLPAVGRGAVGALARIRRRIPGSVLAVLGVSAGLGLLVLGRCHSFLLGDAQVYLSGLERGVRSAGAAHREPLAQAITTLVHEKIARPLGGGAYEAFLICGLLLAIGFLALAISLSRSLAERPASRIALFAWIALGGGLQLFAGYPEFYGFALTGALLLVWTGWRCLRRGRSLYPAAAAFVLAGLSHAQIAFAAPGFLFLALRRWKTGRRTEAIVSLLAVPALTMIGLRLLGYPFAEIGSEITRGGALLPPLAAAGDRTAYSAFSIAHLAEFANMALLLSPALPAAIGLALRKPNRDRDAAVLFASLAAGPLLFAFFANPQLGMIRDWDLFAIPLLFATVWAAAAAARRLDALREPAAARISGAILVTCLLHASFWIESNHAADASLHRVRRAAGESRFFGTQTLGEIWRYIASAEIRAGRTQEAAESLVRAIGAYPEERMPYRLLATVILSGARERGGSLEQALDRYHALLASQDARQALAHHGASFAAATMGREDLALEEARRMVAREPEYPELLATLGDFLRRSGRFDEARQVYDRALARDPDHPRARLGLACLAALSGDRAEAERQAAEARARTPWAPQVQQFDRILEQAAGRGDERFQQYLYVR